MVVDCFERKNKYCHRAKISEAKFRELIRYFAADLDATQIAELSGLNRNTINRYINAVRERIAQLCEAESPLGQQPGIDEAFFLATQDKARAGRDVYGKTFIFGLIKHGGRVHTQIVPDRVKSALHAVIRGQVVLDNAPILYDGLVDVAYDRYLRIERGNNEFVRDHRHFNDLEGFWGVAKTRLTKFRGLNRKTFYLHLKECEFRYNYRQQNLYKVLLSLLRQNPLF